MDNISQLLFLVSDSLLIPDIIVLLVLFVRALFLVGSFYNQYITNNFITSIPVLMIIPVYFGGLLTVIGLLVVIPMIFLMTVYVYMRMSGGDVAR